MEKFSKKELNILKKNKYVIWYKDEPISQLNKNLAVKQNVSDEGLEKLKSLHIEKYELFLELSKLDSTKKKDISKLKKGAIKLEEIENGLQESWGFEVNRNYHEWYKIPHCLCPKMDNAELQGIDRKIVTEDCVIHGYKPKDMVGLEKDFKDESDLSKKGTGMSFFMQNDNKDNEETRPEQNSMYGHFVGKWIVIDNSKSKMFSSYSIMFVEEVVFESLWGSERVTYYSNNMALNSYKETDYFQVDDSSLVREATDFEIITHKNFCITLK